MRFPAIARIAAASSLIALISTQPMWAWGADGHMDINHLAAQYLPLDVPSFVRNPNGVDVIDYLGPEPDRWRNKAEDELSQTQAPDHFIDLEWAELAGTPCTAPASGCIDGVTLPRKRYDFIRALATVKNPPNGVALTPEKVGLQPWQVEEVWQRLKVDFREYRRLVAAHGDTAGVQTAILFDAGWLGHYVGDGSQPLHTSIQYNGWTGPNPNGYTTEHHIHYQMETAFVSANVKRSDVEPLVAAAPLHIINDEWGQYLDYLHKTHSFVERTYQLDKAGAFTNAGTPDGKAFVDERIAAGAIELRDMIYSAWVHSADPVEEFHGGK